MILVVQLTVFHLDLNNLVSSSINNSYLKLLVISHCECGIHFVKGDLCTKAVSQLLAFRQLINIESFTKKNNHS